MQLGVASLVTAIGVFGAAFGISLTSFGKPCDIRQMAGTVADAMRQSGQSHRSWSRDVERQLSVLDSLLSQLETRFERSLSERDVDLVQRALFSKDPDRLYRVVQSISRGHEVFGREELAEFSGALGRTLSEPRPAAVGSDREVELCIDLGTQVLNRELHADDVDALIEGHLLGLEGDTAGMRTLFLQRFGGQNTQYLLDAGLGRRLNQIKPGH